MNELLPLLSMSSSNHFRIRNPIPPATILKIKQ